MLTNTILWKNGEKHPPTFKDMRRILRMVIEARRRMGLGCKPWQDPYAHRYHPRRAKRLEARINRSFVWVVRATKPAPPPKSFKLKLNVLFQRVRKWLILKILS
jgi:hypothetical protein